MRVLLERTWFAPSSSVKVDKIRHMGGQRFKRGEHEFPDEWKSILPPSAIILSGPAEPETPVDESMLHRELDMERASQEAFDQLNDEAVASLQAVKETKRGPGRPRKN